MTDDERPEHPDERDKPEVIKDLDVDERDGDDLRGGQSVGGPRPTHIEDRA